MQPSVKLHTSQKIRQRPDYSTVAQAYTEDGGLATRGAELEDSAVECQLHQLAFRRVQAFERALISSNLPRSLRCDLSRKADTLADLPNARRPVTQDSIQAKRNRAELLRYYKLRRLAEGEVQGHRAFRISARVADQFARSR